MLTKDVHALLDGMLINSKSKPFLTHIIHNYFPVSNVEKVMDKPTTGEFKCALSKAPLVSVQEVVDGIDSEEFKTDFFEHLKTIFDENNNSESPMAKLIGDKKLGVTGKKTTTYLSYPVFQDLYSWVVKKTLSGDKHINWILGSIRKTDSPKQPYKPIEQKFVTPKQVSPIKKEDEYKTATFTLGDLDVLQKLKNSLV